MLRLLCICRNTDNPWSVTGDSLQLYVIHKPFQPFLLKSSFIVRPTSLSSSIYNFHYRLAFWLLRRITYSKRPLTITWRLYLSLERRPTRSRPKLSALSISTVIINHCSGNLYPGLFHLIHHLSITIFPSITRLRHYIALLDLSYPP